MKQLCTLPGYLICFCLVAKWLEMKKKDFFSFPRVPSAFELQSSVCKCPLASFLSILSCAGHLTQTSTSQWLLEVSLTSKAILSYITSGFLVTVCFTLPLHLRNSNNITVQWESIWVPCIQAVNLLLVIIFVHNNMDFAAQPWSYKGLNSRCSTIRKVITKNGRTPHSGSRLCYLEKKATWGASLQNPKHRDWVPQWAPIWWVNQTLLVSACPMDSDSLSSFPQITN